jgi:hypothetical protein
VGNLSLGDSFWELADLRKRTLHLRHSR